MCANGEHPGNLNRLSGCVRVTGLVLIAFMMSAFQAPPGEADGFGAVQQGENIGGMADEVHVIAPPHWLVVMEVKPGSFLDCGKGMKLLTTDRDGRTTEPLECGVTLTETLVIPAASKPAEVIIHY